MEKEPRGWTLGELAELLGGELHGPADLRVLRPGLSDTDDPEAVTFAESPDFLAAAEASSAAAIIVGKECTECKKPTIVVDEAREAFGKLLALAKRPIKIEPGVHAMAIVAKSAQVHAGASLGPYCVVESGSEILAGAEIHPFAYIGPNCKVGEGSVVYPHAVLYQDVELGSNCIIHSGAVLGADGFGFWWNGSKRVKVPQAGGVKLGAEVEIGANTAIDRATAGDTVLGGGTKVDNLVQIGHNTRIGEHVVIAGLAGLSGSTTVGDRAVIGGQAAMSHHVSIGDDVVLAGRTGVTQDIDEPGEYFGLPARPKAEALRIAVLSARLPELLGRLRELEARLAEIEGRKG